MPDPPAPPRTKGTRASSTTPGSARRSASTARAAARSRRRPCRTTRPTRASGSRCELAVGAAVSGLAALARGVDSVARAPAATQTIGVHVPGGFAMRVLRIAAVAPRARRRAAGASAPAAATTGVPDADLVPPSRPRGEVPAARQAGPARARVARVSAPPQTAPAASRATASSQQGG